MKRLKYITAGLALCGILAGLTGCGAVNTTEVSVASGTVSGSAVELPDADQNVKKSRYANSDNVYSSSFWSDTDEEDLSILLQMKPDGTVVDKIEIEDLSDVLWVNDEWIYYRTDNHKSKEALCRIPIEKTDSGDRLRVEEKEKLFEIDGEIADELVVTEDSIFYDCLDDGWANLCRYDFDSGESVVLLEDKESLILFHGTDEEYRDIWPVMAGDKLIIRTQEEEAMEGLDIEMYTLDLKSSELKNFYSGPSTSWLDIFTQSGDNIFFMPDKKRQQIYRFDGQKTECMLKEDELVEKMSELNLSVEGKISITEIFSYKDRLYFCVTLESDQDRPNMINDVSSLLSAPVDDLTQIRNEEKVTDYLRNETNGIFLYEDSHGKIRKGKNAKQVKDISKFFYYFTGPMDFRVVFNRKVILQGRNYSSQHSGVSYTSFDYASFDYAVYDLGTGEIEETEAGKAIQQSDDQKLTELYELPWKNRDS